ncbi:polymerase [Escherichia coli]|nr:polymerase [Escherichia coli]EGD4991333.1 polymerase [Escherichia coli]
MKFTDLKIETQASHQRFFCQGRLFRQHDEFTCLTHFPSPLVMLRWREFLPNTLKSL